MRKAKCKLSAKERLERELEILRKSCSYLKKERFSLAVDLDEAKATFLRAEEVRRELKSNLAKLQDVKRVLADVNAELERRLKDFKPYQTRSCRNCKFFLPERFSSSVSECHLNPPTDLGWPKLPEVNGWCGRFEAR